MIKIDIKKVKGNISSVCLTGHAMYDDFGKDIVCAGVSSILTTTVNGILMFGKTIEINEGKIFVIKVIQNNEITSKLLLNMILLFKELETNYPKNIKIREEDIDE